MAIIDDYFSTAEGKVIARQLVDSSNEGEAQTEFITMVVKEFEGSDTRKMMTTADQYYRNNSDIKNAVRQVIGRDPETNQAIVLESKVLANNKLTHNYLKKLTRQKIGYMLSKPFTFTSEKADDTEAEQFFKDVKAYFPESFFKMIKNVGRDSIVKSIGWIHPYYNNEGELKFLRINPEEGIPLWADSDHTVLDAFIRKYTIELYKEGKKKNLVFIDYYSRDGIFHYMYNESGKLIPIPEEYGNFKDPNFTIVTKDADNKEQVTDVNWAKIPFIPFKYDPDEQSLLTRIKTLVDDYDKKTSGISNSVDDFPNSMLVIRNYDGASKEEFVHNKNQYRTIFVQGDGDAKALETPLDVAAVDVHLERLREDIYEFGMGVNTSNKDIRDTSGVALRFLYADLDMDCLDWGGEFEWSIKELLWFIRQDILSKTGKDYSGVQFHLVFNKEVIINETETVTNAMNSKGVISDETIAAHHPWTVDAKKEVEGLYETMEDELALEKKYTTKPATSGGSK